MNWLFRRIKYGTLWLWQKLGIFKNYFIKAKEELFLDAFRAQDFSLLESMKKLNMITIDMFTKNISNESFPNVPHINFANTKLSLNMIRYLLNSDSDFIDIYEKLIEQAIKSYNNCSSETKEKYRDELDFLFNYIIVNRQKSVWEYEHVIAKCSLDTIKLVFNSGYTFNDANLTELTEQAIKRYGNCSPETKEKNEEILKFLFDYKIEQLGIEKILFYDKEITIRNPVGLECLFNKLIKMKDNFITNNNVNIIKIFLKTSIYLKYYDETSHRYQIFFNNEIFAKCMDLINESKNIIISDDDYRELLQHSCRGKNNYAFNQLINVMLKKNISLDGPSHRPFSQILNAAIIHKHTYAIKRLLEIQKNGYSKDNTFLYLFAEAARNGDIDCVKEFVEILGSKFLISNNDASPFHLAAYLGARNSKENAKLLDIFLDMDEIDINMKKTYTAHESFRYNNRTALESALQELAHMREYWKYVWIVKTLVENGSSLDGQDGKLLKETYEYKKDPNYDEHYNQICDLLDPAKQKTHIMNKIKKDYEQLKEHKLTDELVKIIDNTVSKIKEQVDKLDGEELAKFLKRYRQQYKSILIFLENSQMVRAVYEAVPNGFPLELQGIIFDYSLSTNSETIRDIHREICAPKINSNVNPTVSVAM